MGCAIQFDSCLEKLKMFERPAKSIMNFLEKHPTVYKVSLVFWHLVRAAMMVGMMCIPGIPLYVSMPVGFVIFSALSCRD